MVAAEDEPSETAMKINLGLTKRCPVYFDTKYTETELFV